MRVFATTDIGKVREENQDYFYISMQDSEIKLYILADGMGGYKGGEIASSLAVNCIKSYIESNFETNTKDKEALQRLVKNAIEYANLIVYDKSREKEELKNMGTTIEVCLIYNNRAYIGHIGDSRIYRIRKDIIRKLTKDHSYVEKLVQDGTITKEEAVHHPKKNMLMKALGCSAYVEPDIMVKGFLKDDIILMATDGLTNMMTDQEIYKVITMNKNEATKNLIQIANDRGGYDNITVIMIEN